MTDFLALFSDYTFRVVALGSALLGLVSGVLGCFTVLRKQSLMGDGISHAALPGVVLAFILTGTRHTEALLLGALIAGLIAIGCIAAIVRNTKITFDSALALILASFFGLGLVLLTYVQRIPNANQAGLNRFIFGQASTMLLRDVYVMMISAVVLLALVVLFWKEFKLLTFDADYARSLGFPVRRINGLLSLMIVVAIIIGLQTVGVILMSALLIAPAVAARQWTNRLSRMAILAGLFGAFSGVIGTALSSLIPRLPTGPAIVVVASAIVGISLLAAPGRGLIHRALRRRQNRRLIQAGQLPQEGDAHVRSL